MIIAIALGGEVKPDPAHDPGPPVNHAPPSQRHIGHKGAEVERATDLEVALSTKGTAPRPAEWFRHNDDT